MNKTSDNGWKAIACDRPFWMIATFGAVIGLLFPLLTGSKLPDENILITIIAVIIIYPVLEELAFRGAVQGVLLRWFSGAIGPVTQANLITSILFAGAHYVMHPHPLTWLVFIPSLGFGWSRDRHAGLAGPIGLHVTWNAAFVVGALI